MSYFSKLWNKWFGSKPSNSVSSQSTVSASSGVGTPSVSTSKTPTKPKGEIRKSISSRGQGSGYYDEPSAPIVDPLTVAIVANSLGNDSGHQRSEDFYPVDPPSEPSSHLSPYESSGAGYSHTDTPSYSHQDSGYSHSDSGSSYSNASHSSYDSGSHSSYDSGSSGSSDSGGGGGCGGGGD